MNLISDLNPQLQRRPENDRLDLIGAAVATGSHGDLSLEWVLDRTPGAHPQPEILL